MAWSEQGWADQQLRNAQVQEETLRQMKERTRQAEDPAKEQVTGSATARLIGKLDQ